ncbi:hypothetical protein [Pantanalinema sp. GBBB05]|uniref:hypothetical protein n=1 Tax=Pantanalinema sp. GBBB05 TaxID=2604139 RepID=UPI001D62123F|nr:hypothetical protein [Pantanalinema sp. GBBB05]
MADQWIEIAGTVQPGHQVASGAAADNPYPTGTIALQIPYFQALGLDLTAYFAGTLNISIAPHQFQLIHPQYRFEQVHWTNQHPPENFSFSACHVIFDSIRYGAWIYYPDPSTKQTHFQTTSTLEILAPPIRGIAYGDRLTLEINASEVNIY